MAVKIKFDVQHNAEPPTLILTTKSGILLGKLPVYNIQFKDSMNDASELRFDLYKTDFEQENSNISWEQIKDFKLVWAKEWNYVFEIYVETNEENEIIKSITGTSLGEAELSQINLYNIEINTETDIEREDYEVSVLYDEENTNASILNRILEKAPHYKINHVDSTIANIQRTFSFDDTSIYDAFQDISEEIDCLFELNCYIDDDVGLVREINVYDLESYCNTCETRGEFSSVCSECGSDDIVVGYGNDTSIYVSTENLAESISYSTDNDSVKNCFKLEAGDDLMTATIKNCNPNGSSYIWYISDDLKEDMSDELVARLEEYDEEFDYYYNTNEIEIDSSLLDSYNAIVTKYQTYTDDYQTISSPIVGFSALMKAYYDTIDLYLYLNDTLMPSVEISETTSVTEAAKLTSSNLSPVAVQNIDTCSSATATSAVLSMAKALVSANYQVKAEMSSFSSSYIWKGTFTVTNYSDEDDTTTTSTISITVNDDYETFVKQKIEILLNNEVEENTDIVSLFDLSNTEFKAELKKYSLVRLTSFYECCQSCLDILIEQGIADKETWANESPDLYTELYQPYYKKLGWINDEMGVRETEIATIIGTFDSDGELETDGLQTFLENTRDEIQSALDFEEYLGENLLLEFAAYRREDTYQNDNYISDGLDNAELFQNANEFIETAEKEIYKSATLQHSLSATLKNLLVMKEFEAITDYFEIGNWIRIRTDGQLIRLRLIEYEIDFENLESLSVTFSDVKAIKDDVSDVESILNQASSMASSYSAVTRQASNGEKSNAQISSWVSDGLAISNTKIVDSSENQRIVWDSHGMLFRRYDTASKSYYDEQLKIINSTIAITDDNWETVKTAIGLFDYYDPVSGATKTGYGINGEVLVGKLVLGEKLGIYNDSGSLTFDDEGLTVSNGTNTVSINPNNSSVISIKNSNDKTVLSFDDDGNIVIVGSVTATNLTLLDEAVSDSGLATVALTGEYDDLLNTPDLTNYITQDDLSDYVTTTDMTNYVTNYVLANGYSGEINGMTFKNGILVGYDSDG